MRSGLGRDGGRGSIWLLLDSRGTGGIESHVGSLAQALMAKGLPVEVVLYADYGPHPLCARLGGLGVRWRLLPGTVPGLLSALRRHRPALLHTHSYKTGILARLLAPILGIPVVSTYHAGEPGTGRLRLYLALDRATAPLSRPIAVSEAILSRLPCAAELIRNFIALPSDPGPDRRPATVVFVGRLSHEKGPDEFCALAEAIPEMRFAVYGDGPMRAGLAARHGGRVLFYGAVPSMAEHWRDVGLLCMPSRHEGMPMAALEALAHGIPVAAYAVGDLPRCVMPGRTGWLVAPGDQAGLAAAILAWRAQDDAARSAMAAAARAAITRDFALDVGVERIIGVYAQALGYAPASTAPASIAGTSRA